MMCCPDKIWQHRGPDGPRLPLGYAFGAGPSLFTPHNWTLTYFGSIDPQLLIDKVAERISDGTVLRWIRDMLRAGVLDAGQWHATPRGTSQGSVISPLLANIYLDALDQAMAQVPGIQFIRYADDWCALARTKEEAEAALTTAQKVLDELLLTLHPEKTRIVDVRDTAFDFLGFTFFWVVSKDGTGRPLFGPKQAAIERFKNRVRELTRRTRPMNLQMVIDDLAPVIRGWGQYFTISHRGDYYRLDAWIRERCRAFVAKRWNRSPTLDAEWPNVRFANMGLPSLAAMRRQVKAQLPRP